MLASWARCILLKFVALHDGQCNWQVCRLPISWILLVLDCMWSRVWGFQQPACKSKCSCKSQNIWLAIVNHRLLFIPADEPGQRALVCSNSGWQTLQSNGTSMIGQNSWAEQAALLSSGRDCQHSFKTHVAYSSIWLGCPTQFYAGRLSQGSCNISADNRALSVNSAMSALCSAAPWMHICRDLTNVLTSCHFF